MNEPVGIVGAGAFGVALGAQIAARGGQVILWSEDAATAKEINERHTHERRLPGLTIPTGVTATTELAEVARAARLLVLVVPSTRVAAAVRALGDVVDGRHLVVHASGALPEGRRVSQLVREETCVLRIGALAGPALAKDLAAGRPSAVVVASPFAEVVNTARALVATPLLRVYGSQDLVGVELAAALVGAITVAVAMADGLGFGAGPRAVLCTRALAEAARLGVAAGGRERTFSGLAGLGNLLVRASLTSSEHSDDYLLGQALARGERGRDTEGARSVAEAVRLAQRLGVRTPVLDALHAVIHDRVPVKQAAARLLETTTADEE